MVAIVAGNGLGLNLTSGLILGSAGVLGSAGLGRGNDRAYVNAATGNLVVQSRDDLLIGRGLDVQSLRTYNSQGKLNDDNGDNWLTNFARRISGLVGNANKAGSQVTRIDEDGSESVFYCSADGSAYVCKTGEGAFDTLRYNTTSKVWTFVDGASQVKETYELVAGTPQSWRLKTLTDSDGNPLTLDYAVNGLVSTITTANGEKTRYAYHDEINNAQIDASEKLLKSISTVDASGNLLSTRVHYGYDEQRRLQTITVDLSPEDNSILDSKTLVTTYEYVGDSKRIEVIRQSDGSRVKMTYELVGSDYRVNTLAQTVQGEDTRLTTFSYDTVNRKTTVTDAQGNQTVLSYDALGQLLSTRVLAPDGVKFQEISYAYDAEGNVSGTQVALIDPSKPADQSREIVSFVTYGYDSNGNQTLQRDALGNTVARVYGSKNELLIETRYTSPDVDGAGPAVPGGALITRYVYDVENHLRFVVSPEGRVTEYRYDAVGTLRSSIQFVWDTQTASPAAANFTESELQTWVGGRSRRSESMRTDYYYDARGNLNKTVRSSQWTVHEGTPPVSYIPVGGGVAQDNTANLMEVVNFIYDAAGNLLQKHVRTTGVDAAETSAAENYTYDGLGRMLTATGLASGDKTYQYSDSSTQTSITLANGLTTTSAYNKSGELVSLTSTGPAVTASLTLYAYDALGRLRFTTAPDGSKQHQLYDSAGRKVATIDADGSLTEYVYNANNQLSRQIRYAQALSAAQLASLVDGQGRPTAVTLANVRPTANAALDQSSWNLYDAAGRLVKTVDAQGYVTEMRYDGVSRVTDTLKYANPLNATQFDYFRLIPNAANASPQTHSADRLSRAFYDRDGLLAATLDGEGYFLENYYDAGGRLTSSYRKLNAVNTTKLPAGITTATATFDQLKAAVSEANGNSNDRGQFKYYDARGYLRAEINEAEFVTYYEYNSRGQLARKVQGGRVNAAAVRGQQTVTVEIKATGTTTNGTWPVLKVYVAGQVTAATASQTITVDATTGTYRLSFTGVNLSNGTQVDVELASPVGDATRSVRVDQVLLNGAALKQSSGIVNNNPGGNNPEGKPASTIDWYNLLPAPGQTLQGSSRLRLFSQSFEGLDDNWLTDSVNSQATGSTASPSALTQTYSYDKYGRLISSMGYEGYSSYTYDALGNRLSASLSSDAQGSDKRTSTTRYDAFGRVTAELSGRGSAALALLGGSATAAQIQAVWDQWAVDYAYDTMGRRISSTDRSNNRTVYYYDVDGNLRFTINALGEVQESRYNALGQRTDAITYTQRLANPANYTGGAVIGTLISAVGAIANATADQRTQYLYTQRGQVDTTTNAAGGKQIFNYNAFGEVARQRTLVDAQGNVQDQSTSYDRRGLASSTSRALTASQSITTSQSFDAFGRLVSSTNANGYTTTTVYANGGRTVTTTDPLGKWESITLNGFGHVVSRTDRNGDTTTTSYTNNNLTVTTTNPLTKTQVTQLNVFGQALSVRNELDIVGDYRVYNEDGQVVYTVDAAGGVTEYAYDVAGQVIAKREYANAIALPTQGSEDGKTITLKGDSRSITGITYVSIDPNKTYKVRARLRQLSGVGRVYAGVISKDANGNVLTSTSGMSKSGGTYVYNAAANVTITPDMGWQTFEGTISGLAAVNVYDYHKFYAGSTSATPLLIYNYESNTAPSDLGRIVEVDALELIDVSTGQSLMTGSKMEGGIAGVAGAPDIFTGQFSGHATTLALGQVVERLRPDAAKDRTTRYAYDAAGRQVYSVDAAGAVTEYTYDAAGQVVAKREYSKKLAGLQLTGDTATVSSDTYVPIDTTKTYKVRAVLRQVTGTGSIYVGLASRDANGVNQFHDGGYTYTAAVSQKLTPEMGWVTYEGLISGEAAAIPYAYNKFITGAKTANPLILYNYYDNERPADMSRVVEVGALELIDVSTGLTVAGRRVDGTAAGLWTNGTVVNERAASLISVPLTAAQIAMQLQPDAADRLTRYAYDAAGRQIYSVDAAGAVTEYSYDAAGQVVAKREYSKKLAGLQLTGDTATVSSDTYVPIDTTKTYKVRAVLRQVTGTGSIYVGLASRDANGVNQFHDGGYTYTAAVSQKLTPEMGWVTYEGLISGEAAAIPYAYNKFITGAKTANPLILYNYYDNERPADMSRVVEVGALELIDVSTGLTVAGRRVDGTAAGLWTNGTVVNQRVASLISVPLTSEQIAMQLQPDAADRVTRYAYDAAGRQVYSLDAAGSVTEYSYDAAGQVIAKKEYANQVPSGGAVKLLNTDGQWHGLSNYSPGLFKEGDVVTATVRFKAPPNLRGEMFLGDVGGPDPYDNDAYNYIYGNGDWQTLTLTHKMTHDDSMSVFVYNMIASADDGVIYDNLRVSSVMRGEVLVEDFQRADEASLQARGWNLGAATQALVGGQALVEAEVQFASFLATLADPSRDRTTRYVYDTAGRQIFSVDAAGGVTEYIYDAVGRKTSTLKYERQLVVSAAPTEAEMRAATATRATTAFATNLQGFDGTAGVWDSSGQLKLISKALAGSNWASMVSPRLLNAGSSVKLDFTPNHLQRTTHVALEGVSGVEGRLCVLFKGDGQICAQVYNLMSGWREIPLGAYSVGKTYTIELQTDGKDGWVVVYEKGSTDRSKDLFFRVNGEYAWEKVRLTFYTNTMAGMDETSAFVDNIEETSPSARLSRSLFDANGQEIYRVDAAGGVTEFSYSAVGQVTRTYQWATAVAATVTDTLSTLKAKLKADPAADRITYSVYDPVGRLRYSVDALGGVTENVYDAAGQVTKRIEYAGAITPPAATALTLADVSSRIVTTAAIAAADRATRYFYDQTGRTRFVLDAEGFLSETLYLPDGVRQTRYKAKPSAIADTATTVNVADAARAIANANQDITTEQRVDQAGRVVRAVDGMGVVTTFAYDALGNLERKTAAYGLPEATTTVYSYNPLGQQVSVTQAWGTAAAATTRMEFDAFGQVVAEYAANAEALLTSDANWATEMRTRLLGLTVTATLLTAAQKQVLRDKFKSTHIYDQLGQKVATTNAQGKTTLTEFDRFGNAVKITDTLGYTGYFYFDKKDRLVLQVDPEGRAVETLYNNVIEREAGTLKRYFNKVVAILRTDALPTRTSSTGDVTQFFTFDRLGRLVDHRRPGGPTGTINSSTQYGVEGNRFNQLLTNPANGQSQMSFDRLGQLVSEKLPVTALNASGVATQVVNSYTYDGLGQRITMVEAVGLPEARATTFRYDKAGRLTHKIGQAFSTVSDPANRASKTSVTPVEWTRYDALGRVIEVRSNAIWQSESVQGGHSALRYYNAAGLQTAAVQADGAMTHYSYDAQGQVVEETAFANKIALPASAGGERPVAPANPSNGQDANRLTRTAYDTLGRISQKTRHDVLHWTYRESATGGVITTVETSNSVVFLGRWEYDAAGRAIVAEDGQGNKTFTYYDKVGRQTLFIDAEGYATSYGYGDVFDTPDRTTRYANRVAQYNTTHGVLVDELKQMTAAAVEAGYAARNTNRLDDVTSAARVIAYEQGQASSMTSTDVFLAGVAAGTRVKFSVLAKADPDNKVFITVLNSQGAEYSSAKVEHPGGGDWFVLTTEVALQDALGVRIRLGVQPKNGREGAFAYFDNLTARYDGTTSVLQKFNRIDNKTTVEYWTNDKTGAKDVAVEWLQGNDVTNTSSTGLLDRITYTAYYRSGLARAKSVQRVQLQYLDAADLLVSGEQWVDTAYIYDALGNLQTQSQEKRDQLADPTAEAALAAKDGGHLLVTDFLYDALGREIQRRDPEFKDSNSVNQRNTIVTVYDGLGNVTKRIIKGAAGKADRETQFKYNNAGQLVEQTDAAGNVTEFDYDQAGNVIQRVVRNVIKADDTKYDHATRFEYDALARVTAQIDVGTAEVRETKYNAFGDVSARGLANLNTANSRNQWPEFIIYNALGKVERSNSEGGVTKLYLYDRSGNTSMQIKATGFDTTLDLKTLQLDRAADNALLSKTYSAYDRRNQLIRTVDMDMSYQGSAAQMSSTVQQTLASAYSPVNGGTLGFEGDVNTKGKEYVQATQGGIGTSIDQSLSEAPRITNGWTIPNATTATTIKDAGVNGAFSRLSWGAGTFNAQTSLPSGAFTIPIGWPAGSYRITNTSGVPVATVSKTGSQTPSMTVPWNYYGYIEWTPPGADFASSVRIGEFGTNYERYFDGDDTTIPLFTPLEAPESLQLGGLIADGSPLGGQYYYRGDQNFTMTAAGFFVQTPSNVGILRAVTTGQSADETASSRPLGVRKLGSDHWWIDTSGVTASSIRVRGMHPHDVAFGHGEICFDATFGVASDGQMVFDGAGLHRTSNPVANTWISYDAGNPTLRFQPDAIVVPGNGGIAFRSIETGNWIDLTLSNWKVSIAGLSAGTYEYYANFPGTAERVGRISISSLGLASVGKVTDASVTGQIASVNRNVPQTINFKFLPRQVNGDPITGFTIVLSMNGVTVKKWMDAGAQDWTVGDVMTDFSSTVKPFTQSDFNIPIRSSDGGGVYDFTFSILGFANSKSGAGSVTYYMGQGNGSMSFDRTPTSTINTLSSDKAYFPTVKFNGNLTSNLVVTDRDGLETPRTYSSSSNYWSTVDGVTQIDLSAHVPYMDTTRARGAVRRVTITYNDGNYSFSRNYDISWLGQVTAVGEMTYSVVRPILEFTPPQNSGTNQIKITQIEPSGTASGVTYNATTGRFEWNVSSLKQAVDQPVRYSYEMRSGGGLVTSEGWGSFTLRPSGTIDLATISETGYITFSAPSGTTSLVLQSSDPRLNNLSIPTTGPNAFRLFTYSLKPTTGTTTYNYTYQARDASGSLLSSGTSQFSVEHTGLITLGTNTPDPQPTRVPLYMPQSPAWMKVEWEDAAGVKGEDKLVGTAQPGFLEGFSSAGYSKFEWNWPNRNTTSYKLKTTLYSDAGYTKVFTNYYGEPLVNNLVVSQGDSGAAPEVKQTVTTQGSVTTQVRQMQIYNAFGEIAEEFNDVTYKRMKEASAATLGGSGGGYDWDSVRTTYLYNTQGKLTQKRDPQTWITKADTSRTRIRPEVNYGYDGVGRLVRSTDANGGQTTVRYLGGTEQITRQRDAEGYVKDFSYDVFGQQVRVAEDETLGGSKRRTTEFDYDALGRRIETIHLDVSRSERVDKTTRETYSYDAFGQRLTATNAFGWKSSTFYDTLGRVVKTLSFGGTETSYVYTFVATGSTGTTKIYGAGYENFGGYEKITTSVAGELRDRTDYFGRTTWHQDLSGKAYHYRFDRAGWLSEQYGTLADGTGKGNYQSLIFTYYANGLLRQSIDLKRAGGRTVSTYQYDNDGNRIQESYGELRVDGSGNAIIDATTGFYQINSLYQDSTMDYDELGRMWRVVDPAFTLTYEYDANGNRIRALSRYFDPLSGGSQRLREDNWYQYDKLNRFTLTMGGLFTTGGTLITSDTTRGDSYVLAEGDRGVRLTYDGLNQRLTARYKPSISSNFIFESYKYSEDGFLTETSVDGVLRSKRNLDVLGRTDNRYDYAGNGAYRQTTYRYDMDNRQLIDTVFSQENYGSRDADGTTTYNYFKQGYADTGGRANITTTGFTDVNNYAVGRGELAERVFVKASHNTAAENTTTKFTYQGWDTAKQTAIEINNGQRAGSTWLTYDANGFLTNSFVRDSDATRSLLYTSNAQGLVLSRFETKAGKTFKNYWYYADGHVVGNISTDPDASRRNSFVELLQEQAKSGKNRVDKWKDLKPVTSSDFDQNYQAITTTYPANVGGTYIVNGGDTLQSVAAALWGDASMWYLLAEANGMVAGATLVSGQVLVVPNKVTNIHNNANTFKPYNPGEVIGNIDPSVPAPPPPAKGGCGTIGLILMVVVAVVVTIYTAGLATQAMIGAGATLGTGATVTATASAWSLGTAALTGSLGAGTALMAAGAAAVGAAVGSIASQGFGMAIGQVEDFSWKQVGQAALTAGITAGAGTALNTAAQAGQLGTWAQGAFDAGAKGLSTTTKVAVAGIRATVGAAANMALRGDWSWRQIAASAVGAAASTALQTNETFGKAMGMFGGAGQYVGAGLTGAAAGWASSQALGLNKEQTRAVMTQSFVQSLGNAIGGSIASQSEPQAQGQGPWSDWGYVNGSDLQSDNFGGYDGGEMWDDGTPVQRDLLREQYGDDLKDTSWRGPNGETVQTQSTGRPVPTGLRRTPSLDAGFGFPRPEGGSVQAYQTSDGEVLYKVSQDGRSEYFQPSAYGLSTDGSYSAAEDRRLSNYAAPAQEPFRVVISGVGSVGYFDDDGNHAGNGLTLGLKGAAYGALRIVAEPVLQIGDFLQVLNEEGRSLVTGEAPRPINYLSMVGQAAGQGLSTEQIVGGGFASLMRTPDRIADAIERKNYYSLGEEVGALGVGFGLAAYGGRGTYADARMGLRLAAEDFGASEVGQRLALKVEGLDYRLGLRTYAVPPSDGPYLPNARPVLNSSGREVVRTLVQDHDALLAAAERAAGGSLDNFTNFKPDWWRSPDGQRTIEWNPVGHANVNEGPHVTVRDFNGTRHAVTEKYFIEGLEKWK